MAGSESVEKADLRMGRAPMEAATDSASFSSSEPCCCFDVDAPIFTFFCSYPLPLSLISLICDCQLFFFSKLSVCEQTFFFEKLIKFLGC